MPVFTNTASLTYTYEGGGTQQTQSNDVSTTMLDSRSLAVEKSATPGSYRVGETVTYLVRVTNTGSQPLETVTLTDDLGAVGGDTPLSYVPNSARVIVGDTETALTPVFGPGASISITLPEPLAAGETALVVYLARVSELLDDPLPDITNSVTADAPGAEPVTDTTTVTPEQYADLTIRKEADQTVVEPGDTLNYTLTITNSGTLTAESIRIEDVLPANIASVDAVYLSVDGGAETETTNYSYDPETRLFILPASEELTVPAGGTLQIRIEATIGTPGL